MTQARSWPGDRASESGLLRETLELLCRAVGARYGVLSLLDERGKYVLFLQHGLSHEEAELIGGLPQGLGMLGKLDRIGQGDPDAMVIVDDLATCQNHVSLPTHHPVMTTFLGVPIKSATRNYGRIYLTNKANGMRFSKEDALLVKGLACPLAQWLEADQGRRVAEEALARKAQELARSNADLEQFAYSASHDLQEPLRMVGGFAQLLADRYKGRLDAEADELIETVLDGVSLMQELIIGVLAYSRVTARGKEFAPTDCNSVVARALALLGQAIAESGATVTVSSLPTVQADARQLRQLFQNLIGNAIKFRRNDELPRIHVAGDLVRGEWVFSVKDNGIGIEHQYVERIFILFQRLHTRDEYPGTGIGLALCRRIVERHEGRIWIESEPGAGSRVFFTIPAQPGYEEG